MAAIRWAMRGVVGSDKRSAKLPSASRVTRISWGRPPAIWKRWTGKASMSSLDRMQPVILRRGIVWEWICSGALGTLAEYAVGSCAALWIPAPYQVRGRLFAGMTVGGGNGLRATRGLWLCSVGRGRSWGIGVGRRIRRRWLGCHRRLRTRLPRRGWGGLASSTFGAAGRRLGRRRRDGLRGL